MLKQAVDFKNESDYLHDILADLSEADLETKTFLKNGLLILLLDICMFGTTRLKLHSQI